MNKFRLGDLVKRINKKVDRENTDLEFYIGGEHYDSGSLRIVNKGIIKGSTIGPAFNTEFKKGDVLLMSRNPHLRKAGIVDFDGICSNVSYIIRTKNEKILMQSFIPILFQSDIFWTFAEKNKKGSTNFFLNWSDFERFEFNLPEIEEQKKLTEMLWSINDTLESYKSMLENNELLIQAKFTEMFHEIIESKEREITFADISTSKIGLTYKPSNVSDKGTIVLRSGNIQNNQIQLIEDVVRVSNVNIKDEGYLVDKDILMCSRNGSARLVGKTAMIHSPEEKMTFGAFMTVIRTEYPYIVNTFMNTHYFRDQLYSVKSASVNQITNRMLNNYKIFEPTKKEEEEFSYFVQKIDKSTKSLQEGIINIQNLYNKIVNKNLLEVI